MNLILWPADLLTTDEPTLLTSPCALQQIPPPRPLPGCLSNSCTTLTKPPDPLGQLWCRERLSTCSLPSSCFFLLSNGVWKRHQPKMDVRTEPDGPAQNSASRWYHKPSWLLAHLGADTGLQGEVVAPTSQESQS